MAVIRAIVALANSLGIEIIAESERTARPRDLFWPWFAANVSVFGMSYGSYLLGFGISFWQATIVAVIGIVLSFALCGLVAIAGKRGSAPTIFATRWPKAVRSPSWSNSPAFSPACATRPPAACTNWSG